MAGPLLETKFRIPQIRSGQIPRDRLIERLSQGTQLPLTLLSAPAGFGKSTLLTQWLALAGPAGRSVGWLSLDHRDSDPATFWTYAATALNSADTRVGAGALALLASAGTPLDSVVAALLNDLDAIDADLVLVLDDYHLVESAEVHATLDFFLEHLPPRVHLVLASRSDPDLPLAQLRARGQLLEVRAADLRFTPDEAAAYLNGAMGLTLTAADVANLESRTEGWIAALQLAALSMQGREDVPAFIAGFAGDDRYIVDYLAEQVLQRQPDEVRRFLLHTSVLEQLTGPLCDAVTGQADGKVMLATLERGNLFLIPLDDRRQWYRYHHLFGDVLRAHLLDEEPDAVAPLQSAASAWYERSGDHVEAIRYAIAAHEFERAAELLELAGPVMQQNRQEVALRDWISALPDDVVRVRPVLSNTLAGALLSTGAIDGVERRLQDAERFIPAPGHASDPASRSPELVVVDDLAFAWLPAAIAVHRAGLSLVRGDVDGTFAHARRAQALADPEDHLVRAAAMALTGLASWATGDLEVAERAYADCLIDMEAAGHISDVLGCSIALADIELTLGHPGRAMRSYRQALHLAAEQPGPPLRGTADMHVGLAEVHLERRDLDAARRELELSHQVGERAALPQHAYRRRVALARICEAEGDLDGALDQLASAALVFTTDFSPNVRPIPAAMARVRIAQGEFSEALDWAHEQGITASDDLHYVREFEHLTLARALLAKHDAERDEGSLDDVTGLLERLLRAAEDGRRMASVVDVLVLQSRALQARGDAGAAHTALQRAIVLAEPEGLVRVFADQARSLTPLLREFSRQEPGSSYARRLLALAEPGTAAPPAPQGWVEPLSDRELDVLRLLATELDGPSIARALFISLNTMRTHTRSIYTKLEVTNRRAAVRRAEELRLLA